MKYKGTFTKINDDESVFVPAKSGLWIAQLYAHASSIPLGVSTIDSLSIPSDTRELFITAINYTQWLGTGSPSDTLFHGFSVESPELILIQLHGGDSLWFTGNCTFPEPLRFKLDNLLNFYLKLHSTVISAAGYTAMVNMWGYKV